ncbi:hypothetical protein GCM10009525_72770 [Streptosporangium amethystogenes subsp. fukuiense]
MGTMGAVGSFGPIGVARPVGAMVAVGGGAPVVVIGEAHPAAASSRAIDTIRTRMLPPESNARTASGPGRVPRKVIAGSFPGWDIDRRLACTDAPLRRHIE